MFYGVESHGGAEGPSTWVCRFMKDSKLLYKVSGHYEHQLAKAAATSTHPQGSTTNSPSEDKGRKLSEKKSS